MSLYNHCDNTPENTFKQPSLSSTRMSSKIKAFSGRQYKLQKKADSSYPLSIATNTYSSNIQNYDFNESNNSNKEQNTLSIKHNYHKVSQLLFQMIEFFHRHCLVILKMIIMMIVLYQRQKNIYKVFHLLIKLIF